MLLFLILTSSQHSLIPPLALSKVIKMCKERHLEITAAINADHGGSKLRGLADTAVIYGDAQVALDNLDSW
jgi:hypothetical protein